MMNTWQKAFVLHRRLYRDTSLLLVLFTEYCGRLTVIARGVQRHRHPWLTLLHPFIPLQVDYVQSKQGFPRLRGVERLHASISLQRNPKALLQGLYVNELLMRLLPEDDPAQTLFETYALTTQALTYPEPDPEKGLRILELTLLNTLGYGLLLTHEAKTGQPILPTYTYFFQPDLGLVPPLADGETNEFQNSLFLGQDILAIAAANLTESSVRRAAKRLTRQALAPFLGDKPLYSRQLYRYHLELNRSSKGVDR